MRRASLVAAVLALAAGFAWMAAEQGPGRGVVHVPGGDIRRGEEALRRRGCGSCHTIPEIPGATGTVGPPLKGVKLRSYLAGRVPNDLDNLMKWIRHPRDVDAKTAMPELGVTEQEARDIAAFLYAAP